MAVRGLGEEMAILHMNTGYFSKLFTILSLDTPPRQGFARVKRLKMKKEKTDSAPMGSLYYNEWAAAGWFSCQGLPDFLSLFFDSLTNFLVTSGYFTRLKVLLCVFNIKKYTRVFGAHSVEVTNNTEFKRC